MRFISQQRLYTCIHLEISETNSFQEITDVLIVHYERKCFEAVFLNSWSLSLEGKQFFMGGQMKNKWRINE